MTADTPAAGGTAERFEVRRQIAATPAAIFALLSDPQGHVAIDSSGMLQSAEGEPFRQAGDTFVVHMDREALNDYPMGRYDVTVIIIRFQPNREIEWTISGTIQPPLRHLYGYRLEPSDDGSALKPNRSKSGGRPRSGSPICPDGPGPRPSPR